MRVAKPSIEEPDAAEPARPDLWGGPGSATTLVYPTPTMQAGLAPRRLTFRDVFVCQPSLSVGIDVIMCAGRAGCPTPRDRNSFWPPDQQLMAEAPLIREQCDRFESCRLSFGPAHDFLGEVCCKCVGDVLGRDLASVQHEDKRRTLHAQK